MVIRASNPVRAARSAAFTLIEALLALAISGVVLAAIGGVFYSALKLRDRTFATLNDGSVLQPVLGLLKRDLRGAMPPQGTMIGSFRCGEVGSFVGEGYGLQFTTTTGTIDEREAGGDLQEVSYLVRESVRGGGEKGMDLVRTVNRNLLSVITEVPPEELLLSGIQNFRVQCFDGYEWRDTWDTSSTDTNLPLAVRVELLVTPYENRVSGERLSGDFAPTQIIVPLVVQARTNAPSSTEQGATE